MDPLIRDEETSSGDTKLAAQARAEEIAKALPSMTREDKMVVAAELKSSPAPTGALESALERGGDRMASWEIEASHLGVTNGARARFVANYIRYLPLGKRRAAYERLKEKKIVTLEVEKPIETIAR